MNMKHVAENLPPYIAAAVLKTIANAWCTSARFHNEQVLQCHFCKQDQGDSLLHMFECRVVHEMIESFRKEMQFWILQLPPHRVPTMIYPFGNLTLLTRVATMVEAWYYTFNWLRHRTCESDRTDIFQMFRARILHSCRREWCIREAFVVTQDVDFLSQYH